MRIVEEYLIKIGYAIDVSKDKVLQQSLISFRRVFSTKLHNKMLKEANLRKGTKSTKYKEVGENSGFKYIMLRKTYVNMYKFKFNDL